jgi:hypothetical protein
MPFRSIAHPVAADEAGHDHVAVPDPDARVRPEPEVGVAGVAEGAALLPFEPEPLAHRDRPGHRDAPIAPHRVDRGEPFRGLEEVADPFGRDPFRLPLLMPFRLHRCR